MFRERLFETARAVGADPLDLATVISYETGGTFDPKQPGPTTQWGQHRGLIQFGEPQARQHGVNWDDPLNSQLGPDGAVASYLRSSGYQPGMGLLDLYSTVNAGAPGLYNRSDANNGGAPGTVRDKVEQQMAGHRQNAMRLLEMEGEPQAAQPSGGNMQNGQRPQAATQVSTKGLLGEGEEERGGILGFLGDRDRRDRLALAFNSMRTNPDQQLAQMVNARQERREQRSAQQEAEAAQREQMEQALGWLQANSAPPEVMQGVAQGVIPAQEAVAMTLDQMRGQEADPTSSMREYEFAVQQGFDGSFREWQDRNQSTGDQRDRRIADLSRDLVDQGLYGQEEAGIIARGVTDNRYRIDERTGYVIDMATGERLEPGRVMAQPGSQPTESATGEQPPEQPRGDYGERFDGAGDAFGIAGTARNVANIASDAVGADPLFPDAMSAQADFSVLREQLINDVSSAYQRQPPAWLLKNIEALMPNPGSPFTGTERAQSQLQSLSRSLRGEKESAGRQLENRELSREARQEIEQRVNDLTTGLDRIDAAVSSFGNEGRSERSGSPQAGEVPRDTDGSATGPATPPRADSASSLTPDQISGMSREEIGQVDVMSLPDDALDAFERRLQEVTRQ